jgi:hypothetical protein
MLKNFSKVSAVFWRAEVFKLGNKDGRPSSTSTRSHRDVRVVRWNKILSQEVDVDGRILP